MKKFAKIILLGMLIVFVLDFVLGTALNHFYFTQDSGYQYRTTFSMEETEADVLIFGSSRATHHYDTRLLSKELNSSIYNAGRDGQFIFYYISVLRSVLKRYKPKMIILDFTGTFDKSETDYDKLSALLPYYKMHPEIRERILLRSKFEKLKLASKIYPFNSSLTSIVVGNLEFNKSRITNQDYDGYLPLIGLWDKKLDSVKTSSDYEMDENKILAFREFLVLCNEQSIPLVVFNSPIHYLYDKNYTLEICQEICRETGVPYYDFSRENSYLSDRTLFADESHLNTKGAEKYTKDVVKIINNKSLFNKASANN